MEHSISPFILGTAPHVTAFLTGLFGGVHCAGMCGGIVGALTYGLPPAVQERSAVLVGYLLAYNGGRILTYTAAGALVGWLGSLAGGMLVEYQSWVVLRTFAALFMIALGAYLGGWWPGLQHIERIGGHLWKMLQPVGKSFLPIRSPGQALVLGVLWGWLPCGLVYTMLIWTIAAGGWREGASFMAIFGLGTLPTLLTVGLASAALGGVLRRVEIRRLAGGAVILFGVWTLAATLIHRTNVGLGCPPPGG
jgi:sulfite exporter TauE/SafE